ncbi:MAG: hypothetical protein JOY86_00625 [Candidatus Eremiobacteraeota bacterium]|nr:hypothetical protein [Candidatus Eremiobacteraeota bacterium]
MSLELVNTIATTVTAVVIAATAIAALVQLRHMRAANQITALLAVQNELDCADFRDAEVVVREEFLEMLEDPGFCRYVIAMSRPGFKGKMDERYLKVRQSALLLANTFENLGSMVKNGMIDSNLVLDIYCWSVNGYWNRLAPLTALMRAASGMPALYENFEYLAVLSKRFMKEYPATYPPNVERLPMEVPPAAKGLL